MKNILLFTTHFITILILSCSNSVSKNSTNTMLDTEKIIKSDNEKVYKALLYDFHSGDNKLIIFYIEVNGITKFLLVPDKGQANYEIFRNAENISKLFELKTIENKIIDQDGIEQYYAETILSFSILPDDEVFKTRIRNLVYADFIEDMNEINLPLVINDASFDSFENKLIHLPKNYYWLFTKTEGCFINVHKEYDLTTEDKFQHTNIINIIGKIAEKSTKFDVFLFAEIPFVSKLGAEGLTFEYKLYIMSDKGKKISEQIFAKNITVSEDNQITGVLHENLEIEITETIFDEYKNELSMPEKTMYKINNEGEIIKN